FGEKSELNILESIKFAITNKDRVSIATAEIEVNSLLDYLKQDKNIQKIEVGGSYRRRKETIGDIDILVASKDPKATMEHFVSYKCVEKVLGHGDTKSSIWLKAKFRADIRVIPLECFGAAL